MKAFFWRLWAVLVVSVLTGCAGAHGGGGPRAAKGTPETDQPAQSADPFFGLHPVKTYVVDTTEIAAGVLALVGDEQREQITDLAVFVALSRAGLDAKQIQDALHDRPPLRIPYLKAASPPEYGPGRRVVLPDGTAWFFLASDDPTPRVTLARLADAHRVETGVIPERAELFRYQTDCDCSSLVIEGFPAIKGKALFSEEFGYVRAVVSDADGIAKWLRRADDLTFAEVVDGKLVLGGRRFEEAPTEQVTLEQVSTLWQAYDDAYTRHPGGILLRAQAFHSAGVDAARAGHPMNCERFDAAIANLEEALELDEPLPTSCDAGDPIAVSRAQAKMLKRLFPLVQALLNDPKVEFDAALSPGFSLDPMWEVAGFAAGLQELLDSPQKVVAHAREIAESLADDPTTTGDVVERTTAVSLVKDLPSGRPLPPPPYGLENRIASIISRLEGEQASHIDHRDLREYHSLAAELGQHRSSSSIVWRNLLWFVASRHEVQCARYDGPLNGTRVGMTLFYTDTVAKLWAALDFDYSAPAEAVPGFLTAPRFPASDSPGRESTRIWFGPRYDRMSRDADRNTVRYSHIATRLFAAGSSIVGSGQETTPSEQFRAIFEWWNGHYRSVADYEQQFHLHNQIQKWSVLTMRLAESERFSSLRNQSVDRKQQFDAWAASTPLRYSPMVPVLSPDRWIGERECLPRLASRTIPISQAQSRRIEGGVSLPQPFDFEQFHVPREKTGGPPSPRPSKKSREKRRLEAKELAPESPQVRQATHEVQTSERETTSTTQFEQFPALATAELGQAPEWASIQAHNAAAVDAKQTPRDVNPAIGPRAPPIEPSLAGERVEANQPPQPGKGGRASPRGPPPHLRQHLDLYFERSKASATVVISESESSPKNRASPGRKFKSRKKRAKSRDEPTRQQAAHSGKSGERSATQPDQSEEHDRRDSSTSHATSRTDGPTAHGASRREHAFPRSSLPGCRSR